MSRPTLPDTASQGDTGHVADHNTIVDALSELYGEHSEGAGTPEGTVTATPGRTYADTTAGDLWVKNTGTGNTGWQSLPRVTAVDATTGRLAIGGIEMGDTEYRDVSSLLINGWTQAAEARCRMRRTGYVCTLQMYLNADTATGDVCMQLSPSNTSGPGFGFYGYDVTGSWQKFGNSSTGVAAVQRTNGSVTLFGARVDTARVFCSFTWITTDAWPTSLPGAAI